ncbi:MAG: hypothetical protein M1820_001179 [Bogoriella megaspora]|nr:MAG: hypothetical protein M1820_001179 [Bogoriella megaspora]
MPSLIERHEVTKDGHTTSYLSAGPKLGPLLIFVHGWPGIAETWKPQIETFASLGFFVVAPDTRGYGKSSMSTSVSEYRLEVIVNDLLTLLSHLQRDEAIWIGHDWGSGIVSALAAHHPEICRATASLAVPYHCLEYGLEHLLTTINHDIYPSDIYPNGPWDYQVYYEINPDRITQQFEANIPNTIKTIFTKANLASWGQPSPSATVTRDNGRFGGAGTAPDVPLSATLFSDNPGLYESLTTAFSKTGFFGASAYYRNHARNVDYAQKSVNGGFLEMPCLFIEARFDIVCATNLSRLSEPMRKYCRDLTQCSVDAGHWLQLEKPEEVNAALARV